MKNKKFLILPFLVIPFLIFNGNLQYNKNSQQNKDQQNYTIEQVVNGGNHFMLVINDGTHDNLYTWGLNTNGELGLGDNTNRTTPTKVITLPNELNIIDIEATDGQSAAIIDNNGTRELYVWGDNNSGELGLGDTIDRDIPTLVTPPPNGTIKDIKLGTSHSVLLMDHGLLDSVYTVGNNANGQLGNGTTTNSSMYFEINLPAGEIKAIEASGNYSGAVISTTLLGERVYTWGDNFFGQLGTGDNADKTSPTLVPGLTTTSDTVEMVSFALGHSGIVINDGVEDTLYMTGFNANGQLGLGDTASRNSFTEVVDTSLDADIEQISLGNDHTGVLVSDAGEQKLYTFGANFLGQLGIGTNTNSTLPIEVYLNLPENGTIKYLSFGSSTSSIVVNDGGKDHLYTWGNNQFGQLGVDPSIASISVPVLIFEAELILPEIFVVSSNSTETSVIWNYRINDWGIDENNDPWEYADASIASVTLDGQDLLLSQIELTEPFNNVGSLIISNLDTNTIYEQNYLSIIWGDYLTETYQIPAFATGNAEINTNGLPGWEAGLIGAFVGIGIVIIVALIIWAIILII